MVTYLLALEIPEFIIWLLKTKLITSGLLAVGVITVELLAKGKDGLKNYMT